MNHHTQTQELKKAGLKVTGPRLHILRILETHATRHMSAEEIYQQVLKERQDIGLATIYRVLTQFEAADLVVRHHFEGGHSIFELNDGVHHDHLLCVACRKVIEFVDPVIEEQQLTIAKLFNFRITDHTLHIYGLCQACNI